jgi:hypothetical protein
MTRRGDACCPQKVWPRLIVRYTVAKRHRVTDDDERGRQQRNLQARRVTKQRRSVRAARDGAMRQHEHHTDAATTSK